MAAFELLPSQVRRSHWPSSGVGTGGDPAAIDPTLSSAVLAVEIYRSFCERLYEFDATTARRSTLRRS